MSDQDVDKKFQIPDAVWERIVPLLPPEKSKIKSGRPRMDDRKAMNAIFYVLRTGEQWNALPRTLGASSTVHDRFQEWREACVFEKMWQAGVIEYDEMKGIEWEWQVLDACITKAPLGGEATGPNPVDRAKSGTKRSLLTDGLGVPLAIVVAGANRHDMKLTKATLESIIVERPEVTLEKPQHLCADKGYGYPDVDTIVAEWGYTAHISRRGEDTQQRQQIPGYRARRWVVERTHSWMNRFRRLLIRWEKKVANYLALLHFACAWIAFRAAGVIKTT
jgi:putative transposase